MHPDFEILEFRRADTTFRFLYSSFFEDLLNMFYEADADMKETAVDICRPLLTQLQTELNNSSPDWGHMLIF